jgi:glycosyltransferase involved in cell wall biosynthesis/LmbE family N-acetylglucosaminyl deacetylase/uncharacterized coiled-coil protein SlyX
MIWCSRFREPESGVVVLSEEKLIPFDPTDLTGKRVLVLAPHPDDETFGCGGSLALHAGAGDPVKVVFLTGGSRGDSSGTVDQQTYLQIREEEARRACSRLGVYDLEFWGCEDRKLAECPGVLSRIIGLLDDYRPGLVYAPSALEFHPDHRATASLLCEAIKKCRLTFQVAFYEVNQPVKVNCLVDITPVLETKSSACDAYASQLRERPYKDVCLGLNRFRCLTLSGTATHAEGFSLCSAEAIRGGGPTGVRRREGVPAEAGEGHDLQEKANGSTPTVSVIIPTRNRPTMLEEAVRSVLTQLYRDFEVIVVNDGGEDIRELVGSWNREANVVYLEHAERKGVAAARNTALRAARGRYVAYLDDDDVFYPDHLETLVGYLETGQHQVAYTDAHEVLQTWVPDRYVKVGERLAYSCDFDRRRLLISNYIATLNIVHRRDILEETGLFDEELESHEDWDLWIRMSRKHDFHHIKKVTAAFTTRTDKTSATTGDRRAFLRTLERVHARYAYLVTDPEMLEAQKGVQRTLAVEAEAEQRRDILAEFERFHVYSFTRDLVAGKRVLELGCGDGAGSVLLATVAASVLAIEPDRDKFQRACACCVRENLEFRHAPLMELPVAGEGLFDGIVCFEALDEVEDPEILLREVKRLLTPEGIVIASAAGRYAAGAIESETPSARGFTADEFKACFSGIFGHTLFFGQRLYPSSTIFPLDFETGMTRELLAERFEKGFSLCPEKETEVRRFLAVSSDRLPELLLPTSYLTDVSEPLLRHWESHAENLRALHSEKMQVASLQAAVTEKDGQIANLQAAVAERDDRIEELQQTLGETRLQLEARDAHIHHLETELSTIKGSRAWRLADFFRETVYVKLLGKSPSLQEKALIVSREGFGVFRARRGSRRSGKTTGATREKSPGDYEEWIRRNAITGEAQEHIRSRIAHFSYRPELSIVVAVERGEESWLEQTVDSVKNQLYEAWELLVVGDGTRRPEPVTPHMAADRRVKVVPRTGADEAEVWNAALAAASGEFIAFLEAGDELAVEALYENVELLNRDREPVLVYSDEDSIDRRGRRRSPRFKPDFSPDLLLSLDYIGGLCLFRKSVLEEVGGFRAAYSTSRRYDAILRVVERTEPERILHIPKVLFHRLDKNPSPSSQAVEAVSRGGDEARRVLSDFLARSGIEGEVVAGCFPGSQRVKTAPGEDGKVALLIPFRDQVGVLKQCVDSIVQKTRYRNFQIVLVNNQSRKRETIEYLRRLETAGGVRVLAYEKSFNYSAINNYAAAQTDADYLLFLNNDTEVISPDWLEAMLEHAQRKEVGAVGAKLYYPDGRIQHGGIVVGIAGIAGHIHRHKEKSYDGYLHCLKVVRNVSAVTAACMMVRREVFSAVGGFDEALTVNFGDVDICLTMRAKGYRNVFTPFAELVHHEKVTRRVIEPHTLIGHEASYFRRKWAHVLAQGDPYFNVNIPVADERTAEGFIDKVCMGGRTR